jgi:hypothetical protein
MADLDVDQPLAVAVIVIAVLVILQPLSGTLAGVSLNWIGAILVAIGGFLGSAT